MDDMEDLFSPDLFSLAGRTALVTGGSSGIGASAARALRAMGANVALTSRDSGRARSAAERLAKQRVPTRGTGTAGEPEVMGLSCEVTDEREVDAAVAAVMERWGRLDVLVTSAGRLARGSVTDLPTEDLHGCFATNVFGTWYSCRAAARVMTGAGFGRIITLGSVLGSVLTEMNEGARDDPVAAAFVRQEVPLGRWGETHELATALPLLASPHSTYLTGAVLPVDGGYLAH